jgi:hypothetical protein
MCFLGSRQIKKTSPSMLRKRSCEDDYVEDSHTASTLTPSNQNEEKLQKMKQKRKVIDPSSAFRVEGKYSLGFK